MATKHTPDPHDISSFSLGAPDFFECAASTEWTKRVAAFVEAMDDLDRVVLIGFVKDENKLYLSSHPREVPTDD